MASPMRLAFVVSCALLVSVGVACGLDVVGSGDGPAPDHAADAADAHAALPGASADGAVLEDGAAEAAPLPEVPIGPGTETPPVDAGVAPVGDCGSPVIADNFNSPSVASRWITTGEAKPASDLSGNGFVRMIPAAQGNKVAGLFTRPGFTATSFTASFRYAAQRPYFYGTWGDGLTFFWITSGAVSPATLADAVSGGGLAIPRTLGGYALALDAYSNANLSDPGTPSFSLLHVEPAKGPPGSYDWHVANIGPFSGVYDAWRTITITFAGGKLSASVSGTTLFQNVAIPAAPILALGFTAATGGVDSLGFLIDTVDIQLTDPVCP